MEQAPPLRQIKLRPNDLTDWVQNPVTRMWFWNLAQKYHQYQEEIPKAYVQDNSDATHARIAELIGGMRALAALLNARDEETGVFLANLEDLKEVDYEQVRDHSSSRPDTGTA